MTDFIFCITIGQNERKEDGIGLQIEKIHSDLPSLIIPWFCQNARDLPWRRDRDPYHVWLSEIMLQQTRVEAVKVYYDRFLAAIPDIPALASADPELLHKLWEGLGYYTRVRNLQSAAIQIMQTHCGVFPKDYKAVRALKGVGEYTAGAICSICFDLPTPAVDGNVLRVISRLRKDERCVDDPVVRRAVRDDLAEIYPTESPGLMTQALMELGATVCVPNGAPHCEVCPLSGLCLARRDGCPSDYPVRAEKKQRKVQLLTVFVLNCDGCYALCKRPSAGLLADLWEFPNVPGHLDAQPALDLASSWGLRPKGIEKQLHRTHIFTHIQWDMRCYYLFCSRRAPGFTWADEGELEQTYALPTAFRMFREE